VIAAFRVAPAFAIGEKHSVVRTPPPHNGEERPFGPWIIGQLKTAALRQGQPLSIMVSKAPKLLRRGCITRMLDMQDDRPLSKVQIHILTELIHRHPKAPHRSQGYSV
jgi:hypothetical protein